MWWDLPIAGLLPRPLARTNASVQEREAKKRDAQCGLRAQSLLQLLISAWEDVSTYVLTLFTQGRNTTASLLKLRCVDSIFSHSEL